MPIFLFTASNEFHENVNFKNYIREICKSDPTKTADYTTEDRELLGLVNSLGNIALKFMSSNQYNNVLNKAYQNFLNSKPVVTTNHPDPSQQNNRDLSEILPNVLSSETNAFDAEALLHESTIRQAILLSMQPHISEDVQATTHTSTTSSVPSSDITDQLWEPLNGRIPGRAETLMREKLDKASLKFDEDTKMITCNEVQAVIALDQAMPNFYAYLQAVFNHLSNQQSLDTLLGNSIKNCLNNWDVSDTEKNLVNSFFNKLMKGTI